MLFSLEGWEKKKKPWEIYYYLYGQKFLRDLLKID